jgi:hypothetical protein
VMEPPLYLCVLGVVLVADYGPFLSRRSWIFVCFMDLLLRLFGSRAIIGDTLTLYVG